MISPNVPNTVPLSLSLNKLRFGTADIHCLGEVSSINDQALKCFLKNEKKAQVADYKLPMPQLLCPKE
jgi:hypothetical protein